MSDSHPLKSIATNMAPPAVGPYSQAVVAGDFVFVSGQVAIDVATGAPAEGITEQTRAVLRNIEAVLNAAGSAKNKIVKMMFFLTTWDDFAAMNDVCKEFFADPPPARSTVVGPRYPPGTLVGADAIAYR